MNATALLQTLSGRGVTLFLDGDRLRYRTATTGAYTEELRALVAQHRAKLVEAMRIWEQALAAALARCDRAAQEDAQTDSKRRAVDAYRSAVRRLAERHDPYLFTVLPDLERAFARWHTLENDPR
jgi:hypothetical protein